jgi:bifunctional non-homologous end joining protein LigD
MSALDIGRKARQPNWVSPMLATLTRDYFSDPDWVYEPKLDGIRCLTFKKGSEVRLMSRNQLDRTGSFPKVAAAIADQPGDLIVDGEVAAFKDGRTSFSLLQQSMRATVPIVYFVFDVIYLDGRDLTRVDLLTRKKVLKKALRWRRPLSYVSHIEKEGETYLREACSKGWEGLIAKRAAAPYTKGRSRDWLKFKCSNEQELVIGGYTDPQGARSGFGALLVGYYEDGELHYAGKVGTGYNDVTLRELLAEMKPLEQVKSPFTGEPPVRKNVHWLKPKLVAQVGFAEWTPDGRLRHPRFIGLRRDKKPRDVVRELP